MKKGLLFILLLISVCTVYSQSTYYWVGGLNASTGINTSTNWNTALNGSGTSRPLSANAADVLIIDGTNLGGSTPVTGPANIPATAGITCAQLIITNNANVTMGRPTTGTSSILIAGGVGDDFVVNAGSSILFNSTIGSIRFTFQAGVDAARVSGSVTVNTTQQFRFENGVTGLPGTFRFTSGSSFTTNITSTTTSYAFGNATQSSEKWVVFEDGSDLFFNGGYSPVSNTASYSAIDFKPNSTWHHRAANSLGSFVNRKSFGNISVENAATLTADGPIYRINNLTVQTGCTFITHTSGQTAVMGNVVADGTISSPAGSTNELLMAGNTPQSIGGTGTITVPGFTVAANANTTLNSNIAVINDVNIFGRCNFTNRQITGVTTFSARGLFAPVNATGNTATGNYFITANAGIAADAKGKLITGAGIPAATTVVSFSQTNDTVYISNPVTATANAVAISIASNPCTLQTANANGFNVTNGSVVVSGNATFNDNINYIIDAATTTPFGVTTGSTGNMIAVGMLTVNAPATVNKGANISNTVLLNAKLTLRPTDTLRILTGANIAGTFDATKYIATDYITATGVQSIVQLDAVSAATTIPVGTTVHYLPLTLTPASASGYAISVFTGMTTNGAVNGTALTPTQKQQVVDAVWNINQISGTGSAVALLNWPIALEGATFTTLPNTEIGLIRNTGSSWALPIGTGNNAANTVTATITSSGAYGAGAKPQVNPFIFNALPVKTYGDADFNGGATSLNTTQPIIYTSSNPAVATIVAGNIRIIGAGTSDITASQASDGFYPAANVTRTLTVNKAALTITADNKSRFEQLTNPPLTITYTGFVLGETNAVLLTQPSIATTAVVASAPGTYAITVSGATSNNYNITHVNGTLTIIPKQNQVITFAALPAKTYGNANFAAGGTSTNATTPIVYTSSDVNVATITGSTIRIVGAGTVTITATQAGSDGFFPATPVARVLTVSKANLTIRVLDTVRIANTPNPSFTIRYTGFVLGDTVVNLTTPPVASTTAVDNSAPGYYPITLSGATSNNYNITYTNGRLTVLPLSGTNEKYINAFRNAAGNITVRVFSNEPVLGDITVYNMAGQPLLRKNLFMPVGFTNTDVVAQSLPSGIYIVTVRGEGVKLTKQIAFVK
jgi:trimeric autotransporter adhesin